MSNREIKREQVERLQDLSLSYHMYLLGKRGFLTGVIIGVSGSITASYLIELDLLLFKPFSLFGLILRIVGMGSVLGYFIYNNRKRLKQIETLLKRIHDRSEKLQSELADTEK